MRGWEQAVSLSAHAMSRVMTYATPFSHRMPPLCGRTSGLSARFVCFVLLMPWKRPACPPELAIAAEWLRHDNRKDSSMKLRIDTVGVSFVCTRAPEQRIAFDSGQPKLDRDTGLPLWQVQLMALDS